MAKVLIVSDNHGKKETLAGIIDKEKPIDLMIHCGDSEFSGGLATLQKMADVPVYAVAGNCDIFSDLPGRVDFDFQGHHILVTHGHFDNANYGTDEIYRKARLVGADIAFFGHTHVPLVRRDEGVLIANPGSTDKPRQTGRESTYLIMIIENDREPEIERKKYLN